MEILMYAIAFVAGGILSHILFNGSKPNVFEESLLQNIMAGRRVIVSIDSECHIFELIDGKLRITQGYTDYTPEPLNLGESNGAVQRESVVLDFVNPNKSTDSDKGES